MTYEMLNKLDKFLRDELMKCVFFKGNCLKSAEYRIEHSYRVAYIAKELALKEHFDVDKAFIAGLFHDLGYSVEYASFEEFKEHGRIGARLLKPFLLSLGYNKEDVLEMCYAVAIHADGKSYFKHEDTILALSIRDADDIDRVDVYRLYEGLQNINYKFLKIEEQEQYVLNTLSTLYDLKKIKRSTLSAQIMYEEKIDFQIEFLNRLLNQIKHSKLIGDKHE